MTWYVKLLIALFVAGAGAAGVWAYNNAIQTAVEAKAAAATAQKAADDQKTANEDLQVKVAKLNLLLNKKVADDAKFRQQYNDFASRFQGAVESDPAARSWADAPVPASVRASVRQQPVRGDGNQNPSGSRSPDNKAGSTPLRVPDQWGSAPNR